MPSTGLSHPSVFGRNHLPSRSPLQTASIKLAGELKAPREIERKFLLRRLPRDLAEYPHEEIEQGYLSIERRGVQVRLRRKGKVRSLTYKRGDGRAREEREVVLSAKQFAALWPATEGRRLTKIRCEVPHRKHMIEIDVYTGRHEGTIVAEVEFADEKSCRDFVPPAWLGDEVTDDKRYSNVALALKK